MRNIVSSGIIPFRTTRDKIEYLVLKSRTRDWEFPKGTIEEDEELEQTALREIEEETDITNIKIINGFREEYTYKFEIDGELVNKKVHLFLGKSYEAKANLSEEHSDYQWRTYDLAKNTLTHDSTKNILDKADNFIQNKGHLNGM